MFWSLKNFGINNNSPFPEKALNGPNQGKIMSQIYSRLLAKLDYTWASRLLPFLV